MSEEIKMPPPQAFGYIPTPTFDFHTSRVIEPSARTRLTEIHVPNLAVATWMIYGPEHIICDVFKDGMHWPEQYLTPEMIKEYREAYGCTVTVDGKADLEWRAESKKRDMLKEYMKISPEMLPNGEIIRTMWGKRHA